jgi:hypothetical protein
MDVDRGQSPRAEQWLREYLGQFAAAADRAMADAGPIVHEVLLGGALVRLRFSCLPLVEALLPPLGHLCGRARSGQPLLTVEIWDAAQGLGVPPSFPQRGRQAPARGEVRSYGDVGVHAHFQSGVHPRDGSFAAATFFDERASRAYMFVVDAARIPWYERAAPLRTVLQWGLTGPQRLLVHAGAVGVDGHGVMLAGPSGSGKSTIAVAAVLAGHDFLGDDYVLIDRPGNGPHVHSLYATAKLAPSATRLLSELPARYRGPLPPDASKHVVDVGTLRPARLRATARIAAIAIPRVRAGAGTRLRPASASAALMALAPTTVFQAPRNDGAALRPLASLVRQVPAYTLDLDRPAGLSGVLPELIRDALAR